MGQLFPGSVPIEPTPTGACFASFEDRKWRQKGWSVFPLHEPMRVAERPPSVKKSSKNRGRMKPPREKIGQEEREKSVTFSRSSCPYPLGGV